MAESRRDYLQQFFDPNYEVPENWSKESLTIVECKRISNISLAARFAVEIPRRLGQDAAGRDLSADKKLSKRIAYVYLSLWQRFVFSKHAPLPLEECPADLAPPNNWKALHARASGDPKIRQMGSTINWESWWNELQPRLLARRMVIATFALNRDDVRWGYRIVAGICDEIDWIDEKMEAYKRTVAKNGRIAA